MFDIGWGELLVIGIVALIAIGPKELPGALRTLGQWMSKLRRMASEFQSQFQEAMREAEMTDLKKQVDEMTSQAQSYANFDPIGEVRKEFESTQQQIESAIADKPPVDTSSTGVAAEASSATSPAGTSPAGTTLAGTIPAGTEPAVAPGADVPAVASSAVPNEPVAVGAAPDAAKHDAGGKPA